MTNAELCILSAELTELYKQNIKSKTTDPFQGYWENSCSFIFVPNTTTLNTCDLFVACTYCTTDLKLQEYLYNLCGLENPIPLRHGKCGQHSDATYESFIYKELDESTLKTIAGYIRITNPNPQEKTLREFMHHTVNRGGKDADLVNEWFKKILDGNNLVPHRYNFDLYCTKEEAEKFSTIRSVYFKTEEIAIKARELFLPYIKNIKVLPTSTGKSYKCYIKFYITDDELANLWYNLVIENGLYTTLYLWEEDNE